MTTVFASRSSEVEPREIRHRNLARELAGECMVLLENDGALPIQKGGNIALYGSGARRTVRGGTGSGDVNTRSNTNVEQGFVNAGFTVTSTRWLDRQHAMITKAEADYEARTRASAEKKGVPYFAEAFDYPYQEPAPELIAEEDVKDANTETAVYVISRNSGEGADRYFREGDYLLYPEEKENIAFLARHFAKTIVVLNIGGVMDLTALRAIPGVNAILLMTQLGNLGGDALVDALTGDVNPSGKTADTWAKAYEDYPSSAEFSHNGSVHDEDYTDGIYVGYRYFDSFDVEPEYCFGFGRSYTDFSIRTERVEVKELCAAKTDLSVEVAVTVKNTGAKYSGKEVVQIYYSAPEGRLSKPYQELLAYKKTPLLAPGEECSVTIAFPVRDMASYSMEDAAWILEKGDYVIRVGNSSRDTEPAAVLSLKEDVKTQTGKNLFALDKPLDEIRPDTAVLEKKKAEGISDKTVRIELEPTAIQTEEMIYQGERRPYTTGQTKTLTLSDVKNGTAAVEELVSQLTVEEMAELCVGTLRADGGSVIGNASALVPGAAGDSSAVILKTRGVRNMILADGPAGLRLQPHFKTDKEGNLIPGGDIMSGVMQPFDTTLPDEETIDYYQYCTAIPIGWALAQSWNEALVAAAGDMVGAEMEQFHVDLWLAPALNIHRNPLCGRNFEYYSEDPFLAGKTTAAMTLGVQKHAGKGTTIKHFAVNNQEDNRYFVNAHVSERALREVYLKGFEIAVKESQPFSIMTSYNLLNGVHTANRRDLIQNMARDEWGFKGTVMTDWFTSQDIPMLRGKFEPIYPISASTGCIYAGNDIQMPGCQKNVDDIVEAVQSGRELDGYTITLADLQFNAANIIRVVARMD